MNGLPLFYGVVAPPPVGTLRCRVAVVVVLVVGVITCRASSCCSRLLRTCLVFFFLSRAQCAALSWAFSPTTLLLASSDTTVAWTFACDCARDGWPVCKNAPCGLKAAHFCAAEVKRPPLRHAVQQVTRRAAQQYMTPAGALDPSPPRQHCAKLPPPHVSTPSGTNPLTIEVLVQAVVLSTSGIPAERVHRATTA